jgi:hypothetical protein
MSGLPFWE